MSEVINLKEKLTLIQEHWSPKIIAQLNDYHFKLAKVDGEFVWHSHPETDEVFFVVAGELEIALRNKSLMLKEGEVVVIPKGVEHKPIAKKECHILLVEPAGTVNTAKTQFPGTGVQFLPVNVCVAQAQLTLKFLKKIKHPGRGKVPGMYEVTNITFPENFECPFGEFNIIMRI